MDEQTETSVLQHSLDYRANGQSGVHTQPVKAGRFMLRLKAGAAARCPEFFEEFSTGIQVLLEPDKSIAEGHDQACFKLCDTTTASLHCFDFDARFQPGS